MNNKTDTIFSTPQSTLPFSFDLSVAEVFPDMIKRSVPGYSEVISDITQFAAKFVTQKTNCYDLGCSLGAASLAMSSGVDAANIAEVNIIGIDNSEAMLERCQQHINAFRHKTKIELIHDDIQNVDMQNASMVVLNFTLQFIAKNERANLLKTIYQGLNPGGILLLSEKICFDDPQIDNLIINLHHQFKKDNGYSDLEVSQKRNALENVLLPDSLNHHITRLNDIGFSSSCCWLQHYNFASILAIK